MTTHPAIHVVTLNNNHERPKCSSFYQRQFKRFSGAQRAAWLNRSKSHYTMNMNNPMKRSPYLGYLRHAPSQKRYQSRFRFQSVSSSYFDANGYRHEYGFTGTGGNHTNSDSYLVEKSSPYIGFMRHAPPSHLKVHNRSRFHCHGLNKLKYTKYCRKERNNAADSSGHMGYNVNDPQGGKHNGSDYLLYLRYPEQSKYISGRLAGGNPFISYYSICKWVEETERSSTRLTTSGSTKGNASYHRQDHDPAATFEMFHQIASWFLFPIAYDQRSSCSFCDIGEDVNMEDVRRGISLVSSIVKRIIPGKEALLICTGLQQMEGSDSLIPSIPPSRNNENVQRNSSLTSMVDVTEEGNSISMDVEKIVCSPPFPPNHPLHVSVSSLAKAYHVEQAQSSIFSNNSMSSEEIQRNLDIETILSLPTVTYYKQKVDDKGQDNDESGVNKDKVSIPQDQQQQNLEWSWISVPKDPKSITEDGSSSQTENDYFHDGNSDQTVEESNDQKQNHQIQDERCVICLEQFKDGDRLRVLPCEHRFHTGCIDKWLSGSSSHEGCFTGLCPTCKKQPNLHNSHMSNSPSFEVGEDDSMGTMGEDMRVEGIVPSWAFARLGGSIAKEK